MKMIEVNSPYHVRMVSHLGSTIWKEHYTSIIGVHQVKYMLKKFQSYLSINKQLQNGTKYFLLKSSGKFIGYLSIELKSRSMFLSKLYILAYYRQKKIATKTISQLEIIAQKNRVRNIHLTVNINNHLAIQSYERLGFINRGPIVKKIGNGFVMDDFKMSKTL